jgi:hypothetical protein
MDNGRYVYKNDKLINEKGESVMMGWERPIMKRISDILTHNNGDVLNIGFGMGIVDTFIQEQNPKSHTIIENHPDVYKKIKEDGWLSKENVRIIFDKWQNVMDDMGPFDGIYLDTWYDLRSPFVKPLMDKCLKVGGVFSMWHNDIEFNNVIKTLDENYVYSYEYIKNDNLIPSAKEQFENGGFYIDPSLENIVIPIIKRIS